MKFFSRNKDKEEERNDKKDNSRTRRLDSKESNNGRRKKKEKHKSWGKAERVLVITILGGTALISTILAMSARSWKLPGAPRVSIPGMNFSKTFTFEGGEEINNDFLKIESQLEQSVSGLSGVYGVKVVRINSGGSYGMMEAEMFQAASLIKLPVIATVFMEAERGTLNLNSTVRLEEEDRVGGSGSLHLKEIGTKVSYRELVELMGKESDNTAFKMARRALSDAKITSTINRIGMNDTSLEENETTPNDIALFFTKLYEGDLVSSRRARELIDYMTDTVYEDWIPKGITEVQVAHKYGREVHVVNDAGIVFSDEPFVLVIVSKGVVETEADEAIPELARIVYEYETKGNGQ